MKMYLLLLITVIAFSCKKEGLSRDTGNLEIKLKIVDGLYVGVTNYQIYTEEQYYRFINYQFPYTAYKGGGFNGGKAIEKGLPKGNYGIFLFGNGYGYKTIVYVAANKVNEFTMP